MAVVSLEGVNKSYRLGGQTVYAVRDVTMAIEEGVFLAIAGPSGSGKSTLLNLIGCIDTPTSGRVVVDGREVGATDPDTLVPDADVMQTAVQTAAALALLPLIKLLWLSCMDANSTVSISCCTSCPRRLYCTSTSPRIPRTQLSA